MQNKVYLQLKASQSLVVRISPVPDLEIILEIKFPGPAHNNAGLWYFPPSERLWKFNAEI